MGLTGSSAKVDASPSIVAVVDSVPDAGLAGTRAATAAAAIAEIDVRAVLRLMSFASGFVVMVGTSIVQGSRKFSFSGKRRPRVVRPFPITHLRHPTISLKKSGSDADKLRQLLANWIGA
jgi:hypothetical protein